jgi:hypothetical protein
MYMNVVYTQRGFVTFSLARRRRQSGHASLCVSLISLYQTPATNLQGENVLLQSLLEVRRRRFEFEAAGGN